MSDKRPILCLDFDGVLHAYTSGWLGADIIADGPVPGAIAFLRAAAIEFCVHVYSSRSHQPGGIQAMEAWLVLEVAKVIRTWPEDELIDPSHRHQPIKAAEAWVSAWITFPTYKPRAMVTLDDRALNFTGIFPALEQIRSFRPWNKILADKPRRAS